MIGHISLMGMTKALEARTTEDFVTLLRRHRIAAGLTQTALAKKLGLKSPSTVSFWESGQKMPHPKMFKSLARLIGISPLELTEIIEKSEPATVPQAS